MVVFLTAALGLASGYVAAILLYLGFTLFMTAASPHLVTEEGRFRPIYLLVGCAAWLASTTVAGYLSTWLVSASGMGLLPWLAIATLAIALTAATWLHPIEAREQILGLTRPLMAAASLAGVALGCYLRLHP